MVKGFFILNTSISIIGGYNSTLGRKYQIDGGKPNRWKVNYAREFSVKYQKPAQFLVPETQCNKVL